MTTVDDIETYCENGVWKTRWRHSTTPFATGGGKQRQASHGAIVAQWYGVDHIITNPDGSIAEHTSYRYRQEHERSPLPSHRPGTAQRQEPTSAPARQ